MKLDKATRLELVYLVACRNSVDPARFQKLATLLRAERLEDVDRADVADLEAAEDPWHLELRVALLEDYVEELEERIKVMYAGVAGFSIPHWRGL